MKVRITSNPTHWLGKEIASLWSDVTFISRQSGWDITNQQSVNRFLEETKNYDLTINFCVGYGLWATKLLMGLQDHCRHNGVKHQVLNIGSYLGKLVLDNKDGHYEIEKASLKLMHRKICFTHAFFKGELDSKMIDIGFIENTPILEEYPHLIGLTVDDIKKNIKFLMERDEIKDISVQAYQPGMHRVNEGVGPILPLVY